MLAASWRRLGQFRKKFSDKQGIIKWKNEPQRKPEGEDLNEQE